MNNLKLFIKYRNNDYAIMFFIIGLIALSIIIYFGLFDSESQPSNNHSGQMVGHLIYFIVLGLSYFIFLIVNTYSFIKQIKSIRVLSEEMEDNPMDYRLFYEKAMILLKMKLNEEAIDMFSKAIELNPKYADAYKGRGDAYNNLTEQVNFQSAFKDWQTAEQLKKYT